MKRRQFREAHCGCASPESSMNSHPSREKTLLRTAVPIASLACREQRLWGLRVLGSGGP